MSSFYLFDVHLLVVCVRASADLGSDLRKEVLELVEDVVISVLCEHSRNVEALEYEDSGSQEYFLPRNHRCILLGQEQSPFL